jgi:hypothetical protein
MNPDSKISRWVAFLLAPLATIAAGLVAHAALAIFNVQLDPTATAAWMLGAMASLAGLAYKWLHNRGRYEIAHVLGTNPDTLDTVATAVLDRLPDAPQTPATTTPSEGMPHPLTPSGGPGGTSPGQ